MTVVSPLFKWPGSKWRSIPRYPAPMGYDRIIEPYAGSATFSLHYADRKVILWDTNPHLQVLWPWLISATEEEVMAIPTNVPIGTDIRTLGLSPGASELLRCWQRTNSTRPSWTISNWQGKLGNWSEFVRGRVASSLRHLRHWQFRKPDYASDCPAAVFVDPPYQYFAKTISYYQPPIDYAQLADTISAIPSSSLVIACEAPCPKTGATPTYLPFAPLYSTTNMHHKRYAELAYVRRPDAENLEKAGNDER